MNYPQIQHINDILSVHSEQDLKDRGFVVIHKEGYTVIDYMISKEDTFETDLLRELRGIKFCAVSGELIARPLHKFFNIGESRCDFEDTTSEEVVFYEKLDGSMIHPCWVNGTLQIHTRKGDTDVSQKVWQYLNSDVRTMERFRLFSEVCRNLDITPIFEFTSPDNRIVVEYDRPQITVIAIRKNVTGQYITVRHARSLTALPIVDKIRIGDFKSAKDFVEAQGNFEGVVVHSGGMMAKIKNSDYVLKHRTLDGLRFEKDVLKLCLDEGVDDVYNILSETLQKKLTEYETLVSLKRLKVRESVQEITTKILEIYETRKEMAQYLKLNCEDYERTLVFRYLDILMKDKENSCIQQLDVIIRESMRKLCSSTTKIDEGREGLLKGIPKW